jgi:predicted glycosyltransferase
MQTAAAGGRDRWTLGQGKELMKPCLGYYAHHQGLGHLQRAFLVTGRLTCDARILTSAPVNRASHEALAPGVELITLASDLPTEEEQRSVRDEAPAVLHYAPLGVRGLRDRTLTLAQWFVDADPAVVVVDVSVEVTLLCRLAGVAPVVVRQHGDRNDPAHRAAYACANVLLAPWPEWLEDDTASQEVRDRSAYVGAFSRFDGRELSRSAARHQAGLAEDQPCVVVFHQGRGNGVDLVDVIDAACETPEWHWVLVGSPPDRRDLHVRNVEARGWVEDPFPLLRAATVVVMDAGHNAISEAAAARARLVVIPEPRPFDEQHHKARRLAEAGATVVEPVWPAPLRWPAVLSRARALDPGVLATIADGGGAERAARLLDGLVASLTS